MTDTKTIVVDTTSGENVGDILYFDGSEWTILSDGTDGYFLKSNGAAAPSWEQFTDAASGDISGNFPNLQVNDLTITDEEQGSILYFNGSNWVQLSPGSSNYVLTTKGGSANPVWQEPQVFTTPATGDVSGTYPALTVNDLTISGQIQGSVLYYDGVSWVQLPPGSDGYALATQGSGENPIWKHFPSINGEPAGGDLSGTYPNPQIAVGSIVNSDVNSSADIDVSKLAAGDDGYLLSVSGSTVVWIAQDNLTVGGDLSGTISSLSLNNNVVDTNEIVDDAVSFDKIQNVNTDRLIGRDTVASGSVEEISLGDGLQFSGSQSISTDIDGTSVEYNSGQIRRAALTGDVSASAGNNSVSVNDLTISGESAGSILYYNGSNWVHLPVGSEGQKLNIINGVPDWINETYEVLIYKPNGTADGKIFTDLTSLQSAIDDGYTAGIFGEIIFDGSQNSNDITIDSNLEFYNAFGIRCVNVDDLFIDDAVMYNTRYFKSDHMVKVEAIGSVGTTYIFSFDGSTGAVESSYVPYFENINYFNNIGSLNDRDLFLFDNGSVITELELNNVRTKHNTVDNLLRVLTDNGYTTLNIYGENVGSSFYRVSDGPAGFLTINYYGDDEPIDDFPHWTEVGSSFAINNMGRTGAPRRDFSQRDANVVATYNFDKTGEDYNANSTLDLVYNATPTYYPGHFRDSWSFVPEGTNYAANSDSSFQITGAITVEVILYLPALLGGGGDEKIIAFTGVNDNTEAENTLWSLGFDDVATTIEVFHENGAGVNNQYNTGIACPTGEWVHIAFVRQSNGTDYELFLNGVSIGSGSVSNAPTGGTNGNLYVGSWFTSNQVFSGYISGVKISSVAKSSDEIYESADAVVGADDKITTFDTMAALRAGVEFPREGKVYYTLGQDSVGDGGGGSWIGVSDSIGTFTHDGFTMVVPSGGDGSLGLKRFSGAFITEEVLDDDITSWYMPSNLSASGGIASVISLGTGVGFPNITSSGAAIYDVGSSDTVIVGYGGSAFDVSNSGVPTGTTGTDNRVTLFVQPGVMYVENRIGGTHRFRINLFI